MMSLLLKSSLVAWFVVSTSGRVMPRNEEHLRPLLHEVAACVQAGDWVKAREAAERLRTNEAIRTSITWPNLTRKLDSAVGLRENDPIQKACRADVADILGLYDIALKYSEDHVRLLEQSNQYVANARSDTAAIARAAGVDAVRKKDYEAAIRYFGLVAKYGSTWVKELGEKKALQVAEYVKKSDDVGAQIHFAKTFWETNSEVVRMLEEILDSRVSLAADQRKDIFVTIHMYRKGDPAKALEWEQKIFAEFPEDIDLIAQIYTGRAEEAHGKKDFDLALQNYRHVCDNIQNAKSYGLAQFNVGMILKEQGKHEEAIREFEKLLDSSVNDQHPSGNIMSEFRNYRPRAQWEIGHCYRALGRFDEALKAYQDTEKKFPFQSTCGNAHAEFKYRYALYQGLCHEHLGEYRAAAVLYWDQIANGSGLYNSPTIHLRLLDLYHATGQSEVLNKLIENMDSRYLKRISGHLKSPLEEKDWERMRPSATIREAMRVRTLGERHQWPELIAMCRSRGTTAGPEEEHGRMSNWPGVEAVKAMARFPHETVPLLIGAARGFERPENKGRDDLPDRRWLYFALGLCGTPAAMTYLEERAAVEQNVWPVNSVIFSMGLAGEAGRKRIDQLSLRAKGNLEGSIRAWREGRFDGPIDFEFPPLPQKANLPDDLKELRLRE